VTGYFCELALADEPFFYKITIIRDGRNYSVRKVDATQSDGKITFTNICSFKRAEDFANVQVPQDMAKKYSVVFEGKRVEDFPLKKNFKDLR
jgi:acyl-CoA thioesterase